MRREFILILLVPLYYIGAPVPAIASRQFVEFFFVLLNMKSDRQLRGFRTGVVFVGVVGLEEPRRRIAISGVDLLHEVRAIGVYLFVYTRKI